MKLTRIRIRNFRCLRDVELCVDPTTVLIGENNVGKTSILEAVRIALSQRWGQRRAGFGEKDFFTKESATESRPGEPIGVELEFTESKSGEWSEETLADMRGYLRYDPQSKINAISLRVRCQFDETVGDIRTTFQFVGQDENEVTGGRALRSASTNRFFNYVPVFSLNALRDSQQEFQPRAHFWRSLLRSVRVPEEEWSSISNEIEQLNRRVLDADPKLKSITGKLSEIRNIVSKASAESLDLRAMPLNEWDLVSRAEVILRSSSSAPWLPLANHGQGVQSLAVIYLFQAFVDHLIDASNTSNTTPVLLLEEPEAHLHPQAARGLGREIMGIEGTMIIASHSSHFVEKIPIRALRVLRRSDSGTVIRHLRSEFHANLFANDALLDFVSEHPDYSFDNTKERLIVRGRVEESDFARLKGFFGGKSIDAKTLEALERLYRESQDYFSDDEIRALEDPVRRIRGEIFFSRTWVLCEGMSEYLLLHAFSMLFDYPLDVNGVSVIDFQNSGGSAGTFAALARALGFPWIMTCDGDPAGDGFVSSLKKRGFTDETIDRNVIRNPYDNLEESLIRSPLRASLVEIAGELILQIDGDASDEDLAVSMKNNKSAFATKIAERAYRREIEKSSLPKFFTDIYEAIRRKNQENSNVDE